MATPFAPAAEPRTVLTQIMDGFLVALANRDPHSLPLAETVRYTENGQQLAIGDGAWGTVTALGGYRHDLIDSITETIATFATIIEGQTHSILVARITVIDGKAGEIEVMIARPDFMTRDGLMSQGPAKLNESRQPDAHWFTPIPEAERMSREELRRVANLYFVGLEKNDGKGDYPFSDDCLRIENGARTTAVRDAANGNEPPEPAPASNSSRAISHSSPASAPAASRSSIPSAASSSPSPFSIIAAPCAIIRSPMAGSSPAASIVPSPGRLAKPSRSRTASSRASKRS